ncbi:MAG: type II toxin-antitoxin system RelE/ParE family toxin [Vitreimonas sp.]
MIGYTPDAARDVLRHQVRLSQFSTRSAEKFAAGLALAEVRIERRPMTYRRLKDGETRRYSFKINRVTYLVDYRIGPDCIVILRVWHGRQDRPE